MLRPFIVVLAVAATAHGAWAQGATSAIKGHLDGVGKAFEADAGVTRPRVVELSTLLAVPRPTP